MCFYCSETGTQHANAFGTDIGHYTALMWKNSKKIGCATCGFLSVDICHYADEAGNVLGRFLDNLPSNINVVLEFPLSKMAP